MPIFPGSQTYIDETSDDRYIKKRMENFYQNSITLNQSFWAEADIDTRFEAGDQELWNELYGGLSLSPTKRFNFNRIRRVRNMIGGHQRRTRKSIIASPIENADQQTADQFSQILLWATQKEGILETISESFDGALVTGMNLLQVWLDYREDPVSGDIKVDNCAYNSFLIDPFFRKKDLSDCNGIWKRSFLTRREVMSLMPDKKSDIEALQPNTQAQDGKFQFMPENFDFTKNNLLTYDEFYYRDYRQQKLIIDTQTGETFEWKVDDDDRLKMYLNAFPQLTTVQQEIPTVNLSIVVQGRVLYNGPNPLGIDSYPFVPVLGYYNPQIPYYPLRIQGIVRGLRDAQYLYNRRRIIELDILESQINSGWVYKENALVNPEHVFQTGQGIGLAIKHDASMADVQKIQPAAIPDSMIKLSELLAREVQEISGVNDELLGSAVDDKAGILSMLRQGAGLTTLQILFDQLDISQKILGDLMIKIIQNNFAPGKVKRIINEEPAKEFYNKNFGKYDSAVEDGLNTATQRQMQFAQLSSLREMGIAIPDDIMLEAATIVNKTEIIEKMAQQQQQAQQAQEQQQQMQMQMHQAQVELAQARTVADKGLGIERVSRVQENQALAMERKAEARKDDAQAGLNRAKTVKELESLDVQTIEKIISVLSLVKNLESEQNNEESVTPSNNEALL